MSDGRSRRARTVHLPFSSSSDVYWKWSAGEHRWLRLHGDEPHLLQGDVQVSAANVVLQVVEVQPGTIIDPAGNPSPEVMLTGGGKAYLFRDGRMFVGEWIRDGLGDPTRFVTRSGSEFVLAPGTTWVELLPSTVRVEATK
jgi:hypothetical protein